MRAATGERQAVGGAQVAVPIRPSERAKYPPQWKNLSFSIRFLRAQGVCECTGQCGLHAGRRCTERHGQQASYARGKVVLTTMHLNHEPSDCRPENLMAACQRCHNRYDSAHRADTRAATKAARSGA